MNTEQSELSFATDTLEQFSLRLKHPLKWEFRVLDSPKATSVFDLNLLLHIGSTSVQFDTEVKTTIREGNLTKLIWQRQQTRNFLLITAYVNSKLGEQLRLNEINYIDQAGNTYLNSTHTPTPLYIWTDGHRPERLATERADHAFTKAGLRVTYWYLINPNRVNETIRTVAQEVGVGLETVHRVQQSLQQQQFLIRKTDTIWLLINRAKLLGKWVDAYNHRLKPALLMGHFTLASGRDVRDWRDWFPLPSETVWGGEPAADLLTDYLRPAHLTLYTRQAKTELMRQFRLLPAEAGRQPSVSIYQKFWLTPDTQSQVHPLLVYADLVGSADARNAEVAQRIYENELSSLLN